VQSAVPIVGLTGGMGAGKSTALEALRRLGAEVLSTDAVVHELLATEQVRDAVVDRFGPEVAPDGVVDRAAVAARAFASDADREWLEGLLWPLVGERAKAWIGEVRAHTPAPRAAVIEVPLLFESGLSAGYDATIAVISDEALRRERAAGRAHVLPDERSSRQLPQEEKARRATFVVRNDGTREDLERELSAVLDKLAA
jgi:dephospho-CoA kinase